jgi:NitT/TauT family transport system substrate-binding protein
VGGRAGSGDHQRPAGEDPGDLLRPQCVCEDLLRVEGFTDIRYVDTKVPSIGQDLAEGRNDFNCNVTAQNVVFVASGLPITLVAGIHAGCYELFARDGIRSSATSKENGSVRSRRPILLR